MPRPFRLALLAGVVLMLVLAVAPHTAAAPAAACTYVVHEGDTLDTIAARFNTSPSDLAAVNGIEDPQSLQPGVTLVIPDCPNAPAPQARTNRAAPARSRLQIDTLDTRPDAKDIAQPLVDRAVGATVHIVAETRYGFTSGGTGTVVGADGRTFLTAFHVVGDPTTGRLYPVREIRVGPFKDWALRAHVIATDPENDLAVLIVNEAPDFNGFAFAPVGDSDSLKLGDTVYTLGYPGVAHGGWTSFLFDEVMGHAANMDGATICVTAVLEVRYRKPVPVSQELTYRAWITKRDGRHARRDEQFHVARIKRVARNPGSVVSRGYAAPFPGDELRDALSQRIAPIAIKRSIPPIMMTV